MLEAIVIIIVIIILLNLFKSDTDSNSNVYPAYEPEVKENIKDEKTLRLEREEAIVESQPHLFKPNWREFQNILEENEIYCLYHFTDFQNLPSILNNGGLFSLKKCQENNIKIKKFGSNEKSRENVKVKRLDKYIRTSFHKRNPMMYVAIKEKRIIHPVLLHIDRILIYRKDTLFSNINADSSSALIGGCIEIFKSIRFKIIKNGYADSAWRGNQRFFMAEILLNEKIPSRQILNLDFFKTELLNIQKTKIYDKKKNYVN